VSSLPLVPRPKRVETCAGELTIDAATVITVDDRPETRGVAARLARMLGVGESRIVTRAPGAGAPRSIALRLEANGPSRDPAVEPPLARESDEAYALDVTADGAVLRAGHPAGLFYAAETFGQLAGARRIVPLGGRPVHDGSAREPVPCVHVVDAPTHRFRAMHLDVARHFFGKDVVERYVDLLAFYKLNVFHWHLTDDQGFRLRIASHPELTDVGAKRRETDGSEHRGEYSAADAREVVAFAKERFITVIPEIEMPGHARAILASHPELSCTGAKQPVPATWGVFDDVLCAANPATYTLLDDVLRETMDIFPSRLVHVGGDEVPTKRWASCPRCRAKMAREKIGVESLEASFLRRATAPITERGRRVLAWDDALGEGQHDRGALPTDAVVVAWRGQERTASAAARGHDVVAAPHETVYLNYRQARGAGEPGHEGLLPWTKVLAFDPVPPGSAGDARQVLGGQGALWTEHVRTANELETLLLPRLAALAEALWSGAEASTSGGGSGAEIAFASRFTAQRPALDEARVLYFVEPPGGLRKKKVFLETATLDLVRPAAFPDGVIRFTTDGSDPTPASPIFERPLTFSSSTDMAARLFLPAGRASVAARGRFERATPAPALARTTGLEHGVKYKYFEGDFHQLPDLDAVKPKASGTVDALRHDVPGARKERYAVTFDALFDAPADGVYRFVAKADDGVAVEVDGARILEDDGEHAPRESDGEVALATGLHAVRILYFQGGGGASLALACEGPRGSQAPCPLVRAAARLSP